ncbi:MAG: hypothetical protein IAE96_10345 [Chitinophagaceae bacterium]|nr:hypothetical protein [Chitinophagaceae bacterium]
MNAKIISTLWLFLLLLVSTVNIHSQNVAINTTGDDPDVSAMLDIVNSSKGILLPRVALQSTTDAVTVPSPAASLLLYNTNASISGEYAAGAGYYYNAGTALSPLWRRLVGDGELRWDDLRVTLDKGSSSATLGYVNGSSGPQIWFFLNASGTEAMSFTVQLPHTWKEGTTIYPHIHWLPKSTASGNVEWNLDYSWVSYDPVTPQVFPAHTTSTVVANGPFTARSHVITALTPDNAGIDGTGQKISSILICRIWRNSSNANDTYSYDAGLLFVDFHIQVDGWGSRQEYIK